MLSRTRRFAAIAVTALVVSAGIPATTAGAALQTCQAAVSQSTGSETAVVIVGQYADNKWRGIVTLTCHIVQNGVKVASKSDMTSGSVAVLVWEERIPPEPFTVCHEIRIFVVSTMTNYYTTNC